jgi:hypothetical protein
MACVAFFELHHSGAPCDLNSPSVHFSAVAGTSLSVQVFAGIMAVNVQ